MSEKFSDLNVKELAITLLNCETEKEVELALQAKNLLDVSLWRPLGDSPTNYSVAGNQQASPVASLVEKLVNSIDAVLIDECWKRGMDPRSSKAPQSMRLAVEQFFGIPDGRLVNAPSKRKELSHRVNLIATGERNKNPCYSIIDSGEGQSPAKISSTILSLPGAESESNKSNIPFVQGLFNMGGTGVLRFCGKNGYCQLVISRRDPILIKGDKDERQNEWGVTIVRRRYPKGFRDSSVYEYLAPKGEILTFKADAIPALPGTYPLKHHEPLRWGTCIKLYEFEMPGAFSSHAVLDLNYELSRYFHEMALPVRISERRQRGKEKEFSHSKSYEGTLAGMSVRLEENADELLEENFPAYYFMNIEEIGRISIKINVFSSKVDKKALKRYIGDKSIIFTLNGQTHASKNKSFFNRKELNLSYLQDYLLIVVDCTMINPRAREALFMNSRDRLGDSKLTRILEKNLVEHLSKHEGLQNLEEKMREEAYRLQYEDNKPLKEVLQKLIRKSPGIANLFSKGLEIVKQTGFEYRKTRGKYVGCKFPTFFRLRGGKKEGVYDCPINSYCVVSYETDAKNDYFTRSRDRGIFMTTDNSRDDMIKSHHLWNGIFKLSIKPPKDSQVGDLISIESTVKDKSQKDAFKAKIKIRISDPIIKISKPPKPPIPPIPSIPSIPYTYIKISSKEGNDAEFPLQLPQPMWVQRNDDNWIRFGFTENTAVKIQVGNKGFDIFLNKDNLHLINEVNFQRNIPAEFLREQYKCGMTLACLGLYQSFLKKISNIQDQNDSNMKEENLPELVNNSCDAIAQVILPIISIGHLERIKTAKVQEITIPK